MATVTISNLDSDDFNLLSPPADKEAETIQGGLLPSELGSSSRKPLRPALVLNSQQQGCTPYYYPPLRELGFEGD